MGDSPKKPPNNQLATAAASQKGGDGQKPEPGFLYVLALPATQGAAFPQKAEATVVQLNEDWKWEKGE